jgi:hypothetical protein
VRVLDSDFSLSRNIDEPLVHRHSSRGCSATSRNSFEVMMGKLIIFSEFCSEERSD